MAPIEKSNFKDVCVLQTLQIQTKNLLKVHNLLRCITNDTEILCIIKNRLNKKQNKKLNVQFKTINIFNNQKLLYCQYIYQQPTMCRQNQRELYKFPI